VKNDDVMDLIVVFCILFVFMLVLYCFCVANEFSVNEDLYNCMSAVIDRFGLAKLTTVIVGRQCWPTHLSRA